MLITFETLHRPRNHEVEVYLVTFMQPCLANKIFLKSKPWLLLKQVAVSIEIVSNGMAPK